VYVNNRGRGLCVCEQHMTASCTHKCVAHIRALSYEWPLHTYEPYRVAKTHRIPYLYRSFSAKVTYI